MRIFIFCLIGSVLSRIFVLKKQKITTNCIGGVEDSKRHTGVLCSEAQTWGMRWRVIIKHSLSSFYAQLRSVTPPLRSPTGNVFAVKRTCLRFYIFAVTIHTQYTYVSFCTNFFDTLLRVKLSLTMECSATSGTFISSASPRAVIRRSCVSVWSMSSSFWIVEFLLETVYVL